MIRAAKLLEALGGKRVFRERTSTYTAIVRRVRAGLPFAALEAVTNRYGLASADLVRILALPPRTLARPKKDGRLRPDESDRLLRFSRVGAVAEDVLGGRENAASWLKRSNRGLGGVRPLDMLDNDLGAQEVEATLHRIEHGIYS